MGPTAGTRLRWKQARNKNREKYKTKKVQSLKNRIRGLERFLARGGLDDATRREKRKELAELQKQQKEKSVIEGEKKNVEKYKKSRFFERVKVMRKLRQLKSKIEQSTSDEETKALNENFQSYREKMMYIYYYPTTKPYIRLFGSEPLDEPTHKLQEDLMQEALANFEKEQPIEAFHQFCFNDQHSRNEISDEETQNNSSSKDLTAAAALLLKRPSKREEKQNLKKVRHREKKNQSASNVVDNANVGDVVNDSSKGNEEMTDDFFL